MSSAPQRAVLPDARPASLVLRLTPDFALPYVQLARLDRPIGWQLLLAPCWQGTALAGLALHRGPNLGHLALFLIGAIVMRGAGCTYNDILDRKLDAGVERTRNRPLASGRIGVKAAAVFLVAQALVGLAVLLSFNRFSIGLGIASLAIVAVYPLMKRVTSWPQAVLGLAFSWGALMGWAATFASLAPARVAALRVGVLLDDRLRHDLRHAGRARRRDRRHPLDGAPVRRTRPARVGLFYAAAAASRWLRSCSRRWPIALLGRSRLCAISAGSSRVEGAEPRRPSASSARTATRACSCLPASRRRAGLLPRRAGERLTASRVDRLPMVITRRTS